MAPDPLCLLAVHAHPDDESSKGAGTVAKYHAEGVRTVLVCCTGGEEGDILNPAMDQPEVKADIAAVRQAELDKAAAIIGYDEVEMLGYRDCGMPDSEANANPLSFAQAPIDEAVGRLVAIIRRTRPQVVLTYGDEQGGYPHPDHLRVHDITQPAVDRAADPDVVPGGGRAVAGVEDLLLGLVEEAHRADARQVPRAGLESPFSEEWFKRPSQDDRITTSIDIEGFAEVRFEALLAHATQIDPESPFWFGLPREVSRRDPPLRRLHPRREPRRRADARRTTSSPGSAPRSTPSVAERGLPEPGVARAPARARAASCRSGRAPPPACSTSSPARPTARSATSTPSSTAALTGVDPRRRPDADVTFTQTYADAVQIAAGRARRQRRVHAGAGEGGRATWAR